MEAYRGYTVRCYVRPGGAADKGCVLTVRDKGRDDDRHLSVSRALSLSLSFFSVSLFLSLPLLAS